MTKSSIFLRFSSGYPSFKKERARHSPALRKPAGSLRITNTHRSRRSGLLMMINIPDATGATAGLRPVENAKYDEQQHAGGRACACPNHARSCAFT